MHNCLVWSPFRMVPPKALRPNSQWADGKTRRTQYAALRPGVSPAPNFADKNIFLHRVEYAMSRSVTAPHPLLPPRRSAMQWGARQANGVADTRKGMCGADRRRPVSPFIPSIAWRRYADTSN